MAEREHIKKGRHDRGWGTQREQDDVEARDLLDQDAAGTDGKTDKKTGDELKDEIDDLLDEIDEVLESNAEDFVRAYVQKGGE